jgi:hypothetical protein
VHLGTGTVQVTDDVGHTGLVTHEGGQVDGLGGIILGEGLGLTLVTGSTLAGQESQGSVTWPFELRSNFEEKQRNERKNNNKSYYSKVL